MHYTGVLITKGFPSEEKIDKILEPYAQYLGDDYPSRQYLEIEPLTEDELKSCKEDYERWKDVYKEENNINSFEEYMREDQGYDYANGEWGYLENPNGFWDWYEVGGRWCGEIIAHKNGKWARGKKSWALGETDPYFYNDDKYVKCDVARIKDIAFDKMSDLSLSVIVTEDGDWVERPEYNDGQSWKNWYSDFYNDIIAHAGEDDYLVFLDIHR